MNMTEDMCFTYRQILTICISMVQTIVLSVERAFRPGKLLFGALERFWPYFWALERRSGAFRLTLTPANITNDAKFK